MEKEEETKKGQVEERPNRKKYAERFAKSHPDIDFEDKEARYGAMYADRDAFDEYEASGKALGETFEKHPWTGSMLMALKNNPDVDPVTWMAEQGIDIQQALEDDEYRKTVSDKIAAFEKKQLEGKQADEEREANLVKSAETLKSLGLEDEENGKMWQHLFEEVVDPALRGEVSQETWELVKKALNYDGDVASAREEGGMQARNAKLANKVKQPTEAPLPPDLASGSGEKATPQKPVKSAAADYFEGLS